MGQWSIGDSEKKGSIGWHRGGRRSPLGTDPWLWVVGFMGQPSPGSATDFPLQVFKINFQQIWLTFLYPFFSLLFLFLFIFLIFLSKSHFLYFKLLLFFLPFISIFFLLICQFPFSLHHSNLAYTLYILATFE